MFVKLSTFVHFYRSQPQLLTANMNKIILQLLAATLCFTAVQALLCYNCPFGIASLCITTTKTCSAGDMCFSGKGTAVGLVPIMSKGCLAAAECNKTSAMNHTETSNALYSVTKTCCATDLCNSAPAGMPGALQIALVSVAAVFAANALV